MNYKLYILAVIHENSTEISIGISNGDISYGELGNYF